MKTIDALKTHGPVYFTPKGPCKWTVRWVKPGVTARPPSMHNLQKLMDKGQVWAAHNRPACFGFATADAVIGKSWYAAHNKPKVPSDALRENTREMESQAIRVDARIFMLQELTGDDPVHSMFRDVCIIALNSNNDEGVKELLHRMRENPYSSAEKPTPTLEAMYRHWNDPKSPIRNFLLVRHIDFPEKTS